MPQPGFGAVPEARRVALLERGRRENHGIADFLREGVKDGSVADCDAALVTHICAGAFGRYRASTSCVRIRSSSPTPADSRSASCTSA